MRKNLCLLCVSGSVYTEAKVSRSMMSYSSHEPTHRPAACILLVADGYLAHHHYVQILTAHPSVLGNRYVLVTVSSVAEVQLETPDEHFDLLIIDLRVAASLELLAGLRARFPHMGMVALAHRQMSTAERQHVAALHAFILDTPVDAAHLRNTVARLIQPTTPGA